MTARESFSQAERAVLRELGTKNVEWRRRRCVLCLRPASWPAWRVPLREKFAYFMGPEERDDVPLVTGPAGFPEVEVPLCQFCREGGLYSLLRGAVGRVLLLAWLVGWPYSIWEIKTMPAPVFVRFLGFVRARCPEHVDLWAMTS